MCLWSAQQEERVVMKFVGAAEINVCETLWKTNASLKAGAK